MPVETLEALRRYADEGAAVIFMDSIPADVPGVFQFRERKELLAEQAREMQKESKVDIVKEGDTFQERFHELERVLGKRGVYPEPFKAMGIDFIRKTIQGRSVYFLANLSEKPGKQWVRPMRKAERVLFYDPESRIWGEAAQRQADGRKRIPASPAAGESLFLFCEGREAGL
jgi:hypothetical protein